jgi:hypothetical protein
MMTKCENEIYFSSHNKTDNKEKIGESVLSLF